MKIPSKGRSLFRRGEWVEVLPVEEIRRTLDSDSQYEGLQFMPEMEPFCGRRFRVRSRVEKVFLDGRRYVGLLPRTVLLDGVRCDGSAHGGCQAHCHALWKEAWLKRVEPHDTSGTMAGALAPMAGTPDDAPRGEAAHTAPGNRCRVRPATAESDEVYSCQMTDMPRAVARLAWWDLWRYWRDWYYGDRRLGEILTMVSLLAFNKVRRRLGFHLYGKVVGTLTQTPRTRLDLQPGEWVRVLCRDEIAATLDTVGRNRGLVFTTDMNRFCGRTYQVAHRVERSVIEWSGKMSKFENTVALDGVTCSGTLQGCCNRSCFHLWREAWLERVEVENQTSGEEAAVVAVDNPADEVASNSCE